MLEYQKVFKTRDDLINNYKDNALLLFTLELRYDIDDISSIASEALTDGSDDKKCDLIFIDKDAGIAVIAQAYEKKNPDVKSAAPSNKASDLNTAASWVFKDNISSIPKGIRDAIMNLQNCIKAKEINTIYFWYVHNLFAKNNITVKQELSTLQEAVQAQIKQRYPNQEIKVVALEVGNEQIEKWYQSSSKRIVISDKIKVEKETYGFEIKQEKWKAYVTVAKGSWLKKIYDKYTEDELFSGNPRNFLGVAKRKNNINQGIIKTINEKPNNFWVYNNGVTALVNKYDINEEELIIEGISIINGAQTTGAIGSIEELDNDFFVPIRFIVCTENEVIDEIVSNNNKQNEMIPSDFRSNDKQQDRLRKEFSKYTNLFYSGGRRDGKKRGRNILVLPPLDVGQILLAFHSDPVRAYNQKRGIWEDDKIYNKVFTDNLSAEHIIFVYSLHKSIDEYKLNLRKKGEDRTEIDEEQFDFLIRRGARILLVYAIAQSLEIILDRKIIDKHKLVFKKNQDFEMLVQKWDIVIRSTIPYCNKLLNAIEGGLNNKEKATEATNDFKKAIASLQVGIKPLLKEFIDLVNISEI